MTWSARRGIHTRRADLSTTNKTFKMFQYVELSAISLGTATIIFQNTTVSNMASGTLAPFVSMTAAENAICVPWGVDLF